MFPLHATPRISAKRWAVAYAAAAALLLCGCSSATQPQTTSTDTTSVSVVPTDAISDCDSACELESLFPDVLRKLGVDAFVHIIEKFGPRIAKRMFSKLATAK